MTNMYYVLYAIIVSAPKNNIIRNKWKKKFMYTKCVVCITIGKY